MFVWIVRDDQTGELFAFADSLGATLEAERVVGTRSGAVYSRDHSLCTHRSPEGTLTATVRRLTREEAAQAYPGLALPLPAPRRKRD